MKKLLLLSFIALFATSSAFASKIYYYGGLSTGAAYSQADISRHLHVDVNAGSQLVPSSDFTPSGDIKRTSGLGGVQLGMGMSFDWLYLGIEALGQFSNGSFDSFDQEYSFVSEDPQNVPSSFNNNQTHLRMRDFEPALDFKPGIFINKNSLFYARVGMAFNELKITDKAQYSLAHNPNFPVPAVGSTDATKSENVIGLRLGAGLEHHLFDAFTVFMDYTYTQYGDIQVSDSAHLSTERGPFDLIFDTRANAKATDVNKQTLTIGFNYYL